MIASNEAVNAHHCAGHTQEYYLHLFCPEQQDLNWVSIVVPSIPRLANRSPSQDNEETRQAIYENAMTFWLEKGCDSFRVDTVNMYSKDSAFPDAPITDPKAEWQEAGLVYCNGPRMNEYRMEMNSILSRYDAMTVGECPFTPDPERVLGYVSASKKRLNMVFQFDLVDVGQVYWVLFIGHSRAQKSRNLTHGLVEGRFTSASTLSHVNVPLHSKSHYPRLRANRTTFQAH
ncbi:glycoside hydrolase family 13 protein [Pseudocercospora fijiensis CIRAD86]|uniref:Glycoside hydrolase family 13 protein n=1 Tax=Pseudocercospora fijiensis (strain CIRAD86) TaxID=383855 RepID=M3A9U7_PSEFD|nr:glycoside hydrolase family 13 protein [Pseudocercospora fijiensis CIRAD86]EME81406.1 glycoside hydrolase family 13 protein [Pseudocercospora fijiensis CIRAD86]